MQLNGIHKFDEAIETLTPTLRTRLSRLPNDIKSEAQEIRLRRNLPLLLVCKQKRYFVTQDAQPSQHFDVCPPVSAEEMETSYHRICNYSVHTHLREMIQGYITVRGGHRAGMCGSAVIEGGRITGVRNISSVNLRIAREMPGVADPILQRISFALPGGLLIAGAPTSGKTTLLRDLARQLSGGAGQYFQKITVIDERGELAAIYEGAMQNDLGFCDILDGYPKGEGIQIALRCLSPDIIICDELGDQRDIEGIEAGINAGVRFIASLHAATLAELAQRPIFRKLTNAGAWQTLVLLKGAGQPGEVARIVKVEELKNENSGHHLHRTGGMLDRLPQII